MKPIRSRFWALKIPALLGAAFVSSLLMAPARALETKTAPLMTKWAAQVDPRDPLPEYPRPQMTRPQWQNLNGVWGYQSGNVGDAVPTAKKLGGEIVVPFPVESALSGVMEHHDRLWYRRSFNVPPAWKNKQLLLHFGAVDYEAQVFVNGQSVGTHTGGYEEFSYDITPFLKPDGPQELIVRVFDPTDKGGQPRGKQTLTPQGIMYTPTTGIWQTVWMEPVAKTSVQSLHIVPDVDKSLVRITVNASGARTQTRAVVAIRDGAKVIKTVTLKPGIETAISLPKPKLWSPDRPFLYSMNVSLRDGKRETDSVGSYFGMRKISVGKVNGQPKLLLNNKFVFQIGPLDQGFWPDGLYTAPTDAALKSDIETTKKFGFNMIRKHIKVEPARWYYHADKLGMLVWQDMPSPNSYTDRPAPLDKAAFQKQLDNTIRDHWNSPAIVMWVIFNEQQARHDTIALVNRAKSLDPSRLVNRDSGGGNDKGAEGASGDIDDVHSYPPPAAPKIDSVQASVCGEYGGIGFIVKGHTWKSEGWGYTTINSPLELEDLYGDFTARLKKLRDENNLSAAVYTEITDVEIESNGLMTYDRILKCDPARIALANRFAYPVPTYETVVPTSETAPQTWKYSFDKPADGWTAANFDDLGWKSGAGAFGTAGTPGISKVGTLWDTPDIWLRRTASVGELSELVRSQLRLRALHDEDVEVYVNGVLAASQTGYVGDYSSLSMSAAAQAALRANAPNLIAVHCHQTQGGQSVDVGIERKIPAVAANR